MGQSSNATKSGHPRIPQTISRLALSGFGVAILASSAAIIAGIGSQLNWWHFKTGFTFLSWAAYAGLVAMVLSLGAVIITWPGSFKRGLFWAVAGLLISFLVVGVPRIWKHLVMQVPPIHDISTDLENPPHFVAILPLRQDAPNSADYGGPEIAAQQRAAYPDVKPLMLDEPADRVLDFALLAAFDLGWKIVDVKLDEGRLEATDTTFWFGFKDDVVVRVTPTNGGSRLDIRSVSRVGQSDVGTNARRIQAFLNRVEQMNSHG